VPALRLLTDRLELRPLPPHAAAALPEGRDEVGGALGAGLDAQWPDPGLLGVLRRHAGAPSGTESFGVWVMIERQSGTVVGDIGFHGPPDDAGTIELGYSVVPSRRRRGYATEAASALLAWARAQPGVELIVAGCDPDNGPSVRILDRVGFRRSGEVNGEIRWRYESGCDTGDG
jgi:ribosomal-protein-alanine N-acetyltransferase